MDRVYAVRGAVNIAADTRELVLEGTQTLLKELLEQNKIDNGKIVSIFFTATDDLHSEFPAAAARLMGMNGVPLMCARELEVTSRLALPRTIRVLMHYYGEAPPQSVYLGDTAKLLEPPDPV